MHSQVNHVMSMTPLKESAILTTPITRANEPTTQPSIANEAATQPSIANEAAIPSTRASELTIPMSRTCGPATATITHDLEPAFPTTQASAPPNVIINWLKQQRGNQRDEVCNEVSYEEFGGALSARNQVSTEAVGCRDNGYAYASGVATDNTNDAGGFV